MRNYEHCTMYDVHVAWNSCSILNDSRIQHTLTHILPPAPTHTHTCDSDDDCNIVDMDLPPRPRPPLVTSIFIPPHRHRSFSDSLLMPISFSRRCGCHCCELPMGALLRAPFNLHSIHCQSALLLLFFSIVELKVLYTLHESTSHKPNRKIQKKN